MIDESLKEPDLTKLKEHANQYFNLWKLIYELVMGFLIDRGLMAEDMITSVDLSRCCRLLLGLSLGWLSTRSSG